MLHLPPFPEWTLPPCFLLSLYPFLMKEFLIHRNKLGNTEKVNDALDKRSGNLTPAKDIMKISGVASRKNRELIKGYSPLSTSLGYNFPYDGFGACIRLNSLLYKDRTKFHICQPFYRIFSTVPS